jgi:hypothetical protein
MKDLPNALSFSTSFSITSLPGPPHAVTLAPKALSPTGLASPNLSVTTKRMRRYAK